MAGDSSWANSYTVDQWAQMEANGALFLPAAGRHGGTSVNVVGSRGNYWSASYNGSDYACGVSFNDSHLYTNNYWYSYYRYFGQSVRLVRVSEN